MWSPNRRGRRRAGARRHSASLADALTAHFDVVILFPGEGQWFPVRWVRSSAAAERRGKSMTLRARDAIATIIRGTHILLERAVSANMVAGYNEVLEDMRPVAVVLGRPFFGPFITGARRIGAHVIIDADEDLGPIARSILRYGPTLRARAKALLDLLSVPRLQQREYVRADQVWVTSRLEAARLSYAGGRVHVLPNVIESDPDTPNPGDVAAVAFVGWYRYPPNEAAALELIRSIMPIVHRMGGPRRLVLIGRDPTPAMARASRRRDWVDITGEVPDPRPLIRSAGIVAAPIRSGGGTRIKILEALAAGVPVVSTTLGVSGLDLEPGEGIVVADTPAALARAIREVAADGQLRRSLVEAGHKRIRAQYSREQLAAAVERALDDLVATR